MRTISVMDMRRFEIKSIFIVTCDRCCCECQTDDPVDAFFTPHDCDNCLPVVEKEEAEAKAKAEPPTW